MHHSPFRLLRSTFRVNAIATGLTALPLIAAPAPLPALLGAPDARAVRGVGLLFAGVAALLLRASARPVPRRTETAAILGLDAGWVLASGALLALRPDALAPLGRAAVVLVAAVVTAFALLEAVGLARLSRTGLAAALGAVDRPLHVAITGASTGIGAALARALAGEGVRLTLVARRRELLEELNLSIGGGALCVAHDLGDPGRAAAWIAAAEARHGPIDVLVNNAGTENTGLVATSDPEEAVRLLDLNLVTPLRLSRAVLPAMIARGSGALVQVASVASLSPAAGHAWYGASKAGLSTFSLALLHELRGTGVRVLTVFPGPVTTPMAERAYAKLGGRRGLVGALPEGKPDVLARRIVVALAEGREHLIYPRFYAIAWWLPAVARWITGKVAPTPLPRVAAAPAGSHGGET